MDVLGRMSPCLGGVGALAEGSGRTLEDRWGCGGQFCVCVRFCGGGDGTYGSQHAR